MEDCLMEWKYWKVVIKYGHVGRRNEVSVARYMVFPSNATIIDVMEELKQMPGTKNNCVCSIQPISLEEYLIGKRSELENFYLKRLFGESSA